MSTLGKSPTHQRRITTRRLRSQTLFRPFTELLEDRTMLSGAGLLLSQIFTNPSGNDSPFEYVQLVATQAINFANTPYSVVFEDSSSTNANGWVGGGVITYGFLINTGSVNPGDIVYVGGFSMAPTGTKLRTINTLTTAGDGFGAINSSGGGVLGNGGGGADAAAVFNVAVGSITSSTVPVDAIFFGSGIGKAFSSATTGYQLPVNDNYSGGKVQSTGLFMAPDPGSDQLIVASGSYNSSTDAYPTKRTWTTLTATVLATTGISLTPTLTTPTATSITTSGATLGGIVTSSGTTSITERGVLYSKTSDNSNPQLNGAGVTKVAASGTTGTFTVGVSPLAPGTAYSYVVYATNSVGTSYTTVGTFTTNGLQNSAPVLSGANNLTPISASIADASNVGSLVSSLIAGDDSDVDNGAVQGIAVTGIDDSSGVWQYSTNGGSSWTPFAAVSNTSALLLASDASSTRVRFVPGSTSVNGSFGITFRAWDQTSGTAGTMVDTSINGGSSAFSAAVASSTIAVNSVNTAPVNTVPAAQTILQGTSQVFSQALGNAVSIADADAGSNPVRVTLTATNGAITLGGVSGLTFSSGDGTADAVMVFAGTMSNINAALNGMKFTPTASYSGSTSFTIATNDLGNTGSGGPLTDTDSVPITVVPSVLLNELKVNPPGSVANGDEYQYVELRGTPGTSLSNVYFVAVDGNGTSAGIADYVATLSATSLGTDGLLMIKSPDGGAAAGAGTTVFTDPQFDTTGGILSKHTVSFYLVYSIAPITQSTNFDANRDGTLDGALASALRLDNVGWSDGDAGDIVYGGVALTQSKGTPDAATRFPSNNTPSSTAAWYNGDLDDTLNDPSTVLYDVTRHSANMPLTPSTPSLTPGAVNFDEPPVLTASTTTLFFIQNGATAIDPSLTVADSDSAMLQSATVSISAGYLQGKDALSFTNTANISGSFNVLNGTLTLTGADTVADYQAALRSVTFNTSNNTTASSRTFSIVANDGFVNSGPATRTASVLTPPILSEFDAANSNGLTDAAGENSDWIEIYNPSSSPVDLLNWSLTDSAGNLNEWQFPDVTVAAHAYLVVFADGENITTGSELHTNFSLSAAGEYLALVDPNGIPVTQYSPQYPAQLANVSYGAAFDTTDLVDPGAADQTLIPNSTSNLGTTWTAPTFTTTSSWINGTTGVGFGTVQPDFNITYIKSNVAITNITAAQQVLATPSLQSTLVSTIAPYINYMGSGGGGHFSSDLPYPTQNVGTEIDQFLVQATGTIVIPATGNWSFDVNSDDGFMLTLTNGANTFSSQFAGTRTSADSIAVFNIPTAGSWTATLLTFQNLTGSSSEFSAAQGSLSAFTSAFKLVGNTAAGGLAVTSIPTGNSPLFPSTNVSSAMLGQNASAYIRIPFTVTNPSAFNEMHLNILYNDGFVLYLNGTPIVSRNAPGTLAYNSAATATRTIAQTATPETIDLSQYLNLLQPNNNVLAIQGLNASASDTSFFISPQLVVSTVHVDEPRYFATPTPGAVNTNPSLGLVASVTASVPDGFYTSAISVQLSVATPGAIIRYTTDGSAPTLTNGTVYTGPLSISSTTPLRAQAFETGYISLPSVAWT
jgi:hypothetical protein